MTILQAIQSTTNYPVPANTIETICIGRGLNSADDFDQTVSESDDFKLVIADIYYWLATSHNLTEQEVSLSLTDETRKKLLKLANDVYFELDPEKFNGDTFGFIGENFNG